MIKYCSFDVSFDVMVEDKFQFSARFGAKI